MATEIRYIPTLQEDAAKQFVERAEHTEKNLKATVDFREQIEITRKILAESHINK